MKKMFFKIKSPLNAGLIFGTAGGLASITIIGLTHNGSYAMYLPSLFCIIASIYSVKPVSTYFRRLSTALLTATVMALVSYLCLAFIYFLPPAFIFIHLMRLGEISGIGVICCAVLGLKSATKH
jgi:hypothetical protein